MDAKKFGTFIAQTRKENSMTQLDLAKKLNVTDKAISKWERGVPNLKIPPQNPRLHYFQTKHFWR